MLIIATEAKAKPAICPQSPTDLYYNKITYRQGVKTLNK